MRGRAVSVRNVVAAWKQYVLFRRAYQALRQASRNRRASWLEAQVISAEEAAQRNDIATVYRIVNQIAPKKRRDRVRIRSAAGHILSAEQEYEEIFRYFSRAFQRDADFEYSTEGLQIVFTAEELGEAISKLKSGKAVPTGSVPADVWGVCPQLFAERYCKVESRCYGGIMLSLDLSRAFDELPRAVLLRTLEYAGTPPELCAIIISVHEACKYTVHHGGQVGSFHMAKGVRQGCTLAPLLYSLYTCWLYDELSRRTDEVWAARLLTLFADDTHVPFEIECAADLGFAVRAIRCVFSLFKETGMVVNAGKSKVVVGLRGSAARRWLRRRCCVTDGSTALNFGTPHDPLVIPRVASFVHLGVVASYGSFEALTLSHRLKAASSNRQRLMSVLHCGRFALRHRVRLYVACIRSTLHFGLHAVGVTPATLRRLEAYDARALRAIARSPVHLTRESNDSLRRRLGVASPLAALQKMLGRRQVHSSDEHSRYVYGERLLQLQQVTTAVAAEDAFFQGIPCPECGQYFLNHRHMRSHRACKHAPLKRQSTKAPRAQSQGTGAVSADTYASFALDGMPNCRFCKQSFTRVEGLKKHILQGCQCFTQPERSPPEVTSASGVQVAPERGESTRPATPLVASAQSSTALYADADFIRDLRADWRAVVAKDNIKTSLSTYCVFCHQWISLEGLKMADPMAVETKATVAQAELDLVFGSPASKEGVQEDRPPKWTKQEGGKGAQQAWGGWGNRSKRQWEPTTQSSEGVPDKQTQALLQVATRLILRHESELARLRADTSFVLFIDTGSHSCLQMLRDAGSRWSDLYAKGQVTMPLRTMLMMGLVQSLKQTIDEVRRSEERLARCKDAGWILEGSLPINPNWVYFGWDPKQKQQVVLETDAVSTSDILTMLDSMESLLRKDGVLQNFKSAKQPEELENAEVAPFVLTISLRTQAADEMHHIFSRLSGNACCKLLGFRVRPERIVRQPLAKQLETKFQETAFCDWKSNANWRARAAT
ncbi:LINE-1 retrotransposable element ORF2 protein [Symbiodinium microadriaticum]|uniref:LINE-1 retrotransposable element ORF2 protein n=1 Tax=Symbiodinium microadriaticum TaxID=2951 RepID=A0A1Q9DVV6_SYMMI|nr:LINE-1 retrotransposable element ORF2 protein [Symbiodinium microadriaticum]